MQERLEAAARFTARLHEVSRRGRPSWRRAASIGRDVGLDGERLEAAVRDAVSAGLFDRQADDAGLVMLTEKGRTAAGA